MNRRSFIKQSILGMSLIGLTSKSLRALSAFQDEGGKLQVLRDQVGIYSQSGGTMGLYISKEGLMIIDTQYPDNLKSALTQLEKKGYEKTAVLCNTHHHGDHTGGNDLIGEMEGVRMIAHQAVPELMAAQAKARNRTLTKQPSELFEKELKIEMDGETVVARHFGIAHTGGDAVYHFENANIAHLGDLVFNGVYPYIDANGGGKIQHWVGVLEQIEKTYDSDTLFIFGHGTSVTGSLADIRTKRAYLQKLLSDTQMAIEVGKSKEEYLNSQPEYGRKEMWNGAMKMNMERAWDELTA